MKLFVGVLVIAGLFLESNARTFPVDYDVRDKRTTGEAGYQATAGETGYQAESSPVRLAGRPSHPRQFRHHQDVEQGDSLPTNRRFKRTFGEAGYMDEQSDDLSSQHHQKQRDEKPPPSQARKFHNPGQGFSHISAQQNQPQPGDATAQQDQPQPGDATAQQDQPQSGYESDEQALYGGASDVTGGYSKREVTAHKEALRDFNLKRTTGEAGYQATAGETGYQAESSPVRLAGRPSHPRQFRHHQDAEQGDSLPTNRRFKRTFGEAGYQTINRN